MKRLGSWLWIVCLGLLPTALQGAPRVAVLELHNSTDERLARFDSASEDILAAALRDNGCCQVLDRGQVSSRLLSQPIRLHEIYDRPDRAAALGQALQVDYVVTGRALDYRQDGHRHRMEVELVVVDVHNASYVYRQRLEVETRGDTDRKQHRPLLDQLAALALPSMIDAMDLDVLPDPLPNTPSDAPSDVDLGVQVAESSPPPSSSPPESAEPTPPPTPRVPPQAIYGAPVGGPPRQVHRVPQEAAWGIPQEIDPANPMADWTSQLMDQALEGLSDEDRQKVLEAMGDSDSDSDSDTSPRRQRQDDTPPGDPLDKAWQMIEQGRMASARPLLQRALREAIRSGDRQREARARDGLCEIDHNQLAPQMLGPALAHGWLATDLHRQLGQSMELSAGLRRVAGIEAATGHGAQALETLREAWTQAEGRTDAAWGDEQAEIRLAMAAAYLTVGDPESARGELLSVLDHWQRGDQRIRQARVLTQLAQLDASLGRIGDADGHLRRVLDLYDVDTVDFDLEQLFEEVEQRAPSVNLLALGMGMTPLMATFAAALDDEDTGSGPRPSWDPAYDAVLEDAYRQVLATTSVDPKVFVKNSHLMQAQIASMISPAGFDGNQIPIADAPKEVLCAFFERSEILKKRGRLYEQLGHAEAADTLRHEAWDAWLATSGRLYAILMRGMLPQGVQVPLPAMASVTAEQARGAGAFPPFSFLASRCGHMDFHHNELWRGETYAAAGQTEIARSVYKGFAMAAPHARIAALIGAARLEDQLGNPRIAVALYRDALDWSDALLGALQMEPSAYAARLAEAYDELIRLLVESGDTDEALRYAERARAYALHRQLVGQIPLLPGASEADLQTYQALGVTLHRLKSQEVEQASFHRSMGRRPPVNVDGEKRIQAARQERQALRQRLYSPLAADLQARHTVDLDETRQEIVQGGSTLLVYFTLQDETLAWVIDSGGVHLERLPVSRAQLEGEVSLLLDALSLEQPFEEQGAWLFDALVRPLLHHLQHDEVTVVPHGVLHYLPMAALWDGESQEFLLDSVRLTTAPSVTALGHLRRRTQETSGRALVMGNPDGSLDFAEQEARDVASRLGAPAHLRLDANKERFLAEASQAEVIHLAAHGTFDTFNPMQSHLQLAPGDAAGQLTAAEIFGLDLKATDLVVLSACQTGLGELTRGDDIVGLNRAFLVAGASSVLTTLWRVEDASTAALMEHFYGQLPGVGPAEALRRAQQAVRSDGRWRHPYFWAGFRLSGDGSARP